MADNSQVGLSDIERAAIQILIDRELTAAVRDINQGYQMADLPTNALNPADEPKMSITGAGYLAQNAKAKVQAAKDRVVAATAKQDNALTKIHKAVDIADAISATIEAEADDLTASLGQFSNSAAHD